MSEIEKFVEKPWKSVHDVYKESFLHMRPAPEYASGEVVLASLYRNIGLENVTERVVPALGRAFDKNLRAGKRPRGSNETTGISTDSWRLIVANTLKSPKQPSQSTKRFLQVMPIVPDAAIYSLSARLSANSWNPGELVSTLLNFGSDSESQSQGLRDELFESLSVNKQDDIWARFLDDEFKSWRIPKNNVAWKRKSYEGWSSVIQDWSKGKVNCPSRQFSRDLPAVLKLKSVLTRRQWISMLESFLRLGTASHVMWLCRANNGCSELIINALHGEHPSTSLVEEKLGIGPILRLGQLAAGAINDMAIEFIRARASLNLLLYMLDEQSIKIATGCSLKNAIEISNLSKFVFENRNKLDVEKFNNRLRSAMTLNPREAAGRKGIASNIKEFLRHVLGQRQTAEKGLDSYDQGYFLKKRGLYRSAPWVVSLGPVAVLALVHALSGDSSTPQTVANLCQHLGCYGIHLDPQDVPSSELGSTLRDLGLVLDSPDAEGGMVVVSPFNTENDG